jgi:hypothetical protein
MAPIKFEESLKQKLEKRALQPSNDVWDKLSKQLDDNDKKHSKKLFWWFGLAASIVGIVLVTSMYFNNSQLINETPEVVNSETKSITEPINEENVAFEDIETTKIVSQETEKLNSINQSKTIVTSSKKEQKSESIAFNSSINKTKLLEVEEQKIASINEKEQIENIVDEIKKINKESITVSDREIDSLLKQAERELLKHKLSKKTIQTVDANSLLQDVENDIDQSFRDKVFEALKNSYDSVKTAVAERNH